MALSKKGLRKIVVDGKSYVWKISRNRFGRLDSLGCIVQTTSQLKNMLVVDSLEIHSEPYLNIVPEYILTPAYVAESIRQAIQQGWKSEEKAPPFNFEFSIKEFYSKAGEKNVI